MQAPLVLSLRRHFQQSLTGNAKMMSSISGNINVEHDAKNREYIANIEGYKAFIQYVPVRDKVVDLQHTIVPKELQGRGLAAILAKAAFEDLSKTNTKAIITCSYLVAYLKKDENKKFMDIVLKK